MGEYPFNSLGHALSFLNENNPARSKSVNLLEPDRGPRPTFEDFSGRSPRDLWAGVLFSVRRALKYQTRERRQAWALRNIGPRQHHLAAEEIAEKLSVSTRWVYSAIREINDDLEAELVFRGYLEAQDQGQQPKKHD